MTDSLSLIELAAAGLAGLALVVSAGLHCWRQWLELKRLDRPRRGRGELADLRARVRKLEAIADGIEL
jgi:hypothetical protein